VIVALEDYPGLGRDWTLEGSRVDARRMRRLLIDFGVPRERITTFIAPSDRRRLRTRAVREFSRDALDHFFEREVARDGTGGTLIVCWSGHGAHLTHAGRLHLITPDATDGESGALRSIALDNVAAMLRGAPYRRYTHQVLIVSTCRSALTRPPAELQFPVADPDPVAEPVRQCLLYACAVGRTAQQTASEGSLLVHQVHQQLGEFLRAERERLFAAALDTVQWPDFIELAARARDAVANASAGMQRPVVHATGWDGEPLGHGGSREPPLAKWLQRWPSEQRELHALRCLDVDSPAPDAAALRDPARLVEFLHDQPLQPLRSGRAPLAEFVARLRDAAPDDGSRELAGQWLQAHGSAADRDAIDRYLKEEPLGHVLQLWVSGSTVKAALFDALDRLVTWFAERDEAIAAGDGGLSAAIGAWVGRARRAVGTDWPLSVELCVPKALLAAGLDQSTLDIDGTASTLNEDHFGAVLRCMDQYMFAERARDLAKLARKVLPRAAQGGARVRWASPGAGRELLGGLFGDRADAPVWIGLPPPPHHAAALEVCLKGMAPALFWLRPADVDPADRAAVEAELAPLLNRAERGLARHILDWRRAQIGCASEQVALLLDDPKREPRWVVKLPGAAAAAPRGASIPPPPP
jgi:hypothetical protein